MNRLALVLAVFWALAGAAPQEPPAAAPATQEETPGTESLDIDHDAVGCLVAGQFPRLEACIDPAPTVARARVYFRAAGGEHWYYVDMAPDVSKKRPDTLCYAGILPKPRKATKSISYYVEALNRSFDQSRTEEYESEVVGDAKICKKLSAPVVKSATVAVGAATVGAPVVPAGFAAAGVVGAAGAAVSVATVAVVAGAGAAAASTVAAVSGGEDTTTTTTSPVANTNTTTTTTTLGPGTTTTTTTLPASTTPVNVVPRLALTINPDPTRGTEPLRVVFDMCASTDADNDALSYVYTFGDGAVERSTNCRTEHTYRVTTTAGRLRSLVEFAANLCVTDGIAGHDQCRRVLVNVDPLPAPAPSPSPASGPDCAADRTPPSVSIVRPTPNEVITSSSYTIQAVASDPGSGIQRVTFRADQLDGSARFGTEDTTAPYEAAWAVPAVCGGHFAVAVEAYDNCGLFGSVRSLATHFVTVNTTCPGAEPTAARVGWTSDLEVSGAWGQVVLNGASASFPREGRSSAEGEPREGENRMEAQLVQGGEPGTWRFDLPAAAPGSLRVLAGEVVALGPQSVTFRLAGTPGERMVFTFVKK